MGYSTDFTGELKFKNELTASQLAYLNTFLGQDIRDLGLEDERDGYWYHIDLELTKDFSGLEWNGAEKTYDLDAIVNFITDRMREKWPDFELIGTLAAQGKEATDRWNLVMEDGVAVKKELVVKGKEIQCPHCNSVIQEVMCSECEQNFVLEDEVFDIKNSENINLDNLDLEGKSVVITGAFFVERKELVKMLEEIGASVSSSVSKNTDYLLIGEKPGNSKLSKAEQLNVPKITQQQIDEYFDRLWK